MRCRKCLRPAILLLCCWSLFAASRKGTAQPVRTYAQFPIAPVIHGSQQIVLGHSALSLTGPWKFRLGDDPAWAQPDFNDSAWEDYTLNKQGWSDSVLNPGNDNDPGWAGHGHRGVWGYGWYRIRIHLQQSPAPISLLMNIVDSAYTVFWDGRELGNEGDPARHKTYVFSQTFGVRQFAIPAALSMPGKHVLAVRVWDRPVFAVENSPTSGGLRGAPLVVSRREGRRLLLSFQHITTIRVLEAALIETIPYFLAGAFSIVLFFFRSRQREYLWIGLGLLLFMAPDVVVFSQPFVRWRLSNNLYVLLDVFAQFAVLFCLLATQWLLGLENRLAMRKAVLISGFAYFLAYAARGFNLYVLLSPRLEQFLKYASLLLIPCLVVFLWMAVSGIRRAGREAWLMLSPAIVTALLLFWVDTSTGRVSVGVRLTIFILLELLVPFSVLLILAYRFLRQWREHQRVEGELQQAQAMQRILVPQVPENTPGFMVESVYLPASEVGGDFFQVLPRTDGSLLVIVGDVSGKGLKAAMTVSTIVGALRNEPSRQPAEILAHLNRVLHGQIKGFVTCCAAFITADGEMTVANAGHLAPYRNGEELAVSSSLPLGIILDAAYEETHTHLAPDDRLMFVSDGVVEATNEKRELFGFEHTQAISHQTAQAIAETAKNFGQEDDISVVCVQFLGAQELANA